MSIKNKSILQIDKENQLDRQRKYLFCYIWSKLKPTLPNASEYGELRNRPLLLAHTIYVFRYWLMQKTLRTEQDLRQFHCLVTAEQTMELLSWLADSGAFPEELKAVSPTCYIKNKPIVSIQTQHDVMNDVRIELECWYKFLENKKKGVE